MLRTVDKQLAHTVLSKKVPNKGKENEDFLPADDMFSTYEYTNHARFESMRDYPRRKSLFRKHVDIGKDFEKKEKYYKHCQKWYSTEMDRQIQKVEERFTDLLRHTFESNRSKTHRLLYSYNKWMNRNSKTSEFDKIVDGKLRALDSSNDIRDEIDIPMPGHGSRGKNRLHSRRSVSLDLLPTTGKLADGRLTRASMGIGTPQPDIATALTSISVPDVRTSKQRLRKVSDFKKVHNSTMSQQLVRVEKK